MRTFSLFSIAFAMLFGSASMYYTTPQWNTQDLFIYEIRRQVTLELGDSTSAIREKIADNMELVVEVMISEAERMTEMRGVMLDSVTCVADNLEGVAEDIAEHEENHQP